MTTQQNIGFTINGLTTAHQLNNDNRRRKETYNSLFRPVEVYVVNPLGNKITDAIMSLLTKSSLGDMTAPLTEFTIGSGLNARKFDAFLAKVEQYSGRWGTRVPRQVVVIQYMDTCCIVAARQLYACANTFRTVLTLPDEARRVTNIVYEAAVEEILDPVASDGWRWSEEIGHYIAGNQPQQLAIEENKEEKKEIEEPEAEPETEVEPATEAEPAAEPEAPSYWSRFRNGVYAVGSTTSTAVYTVSSTVAKGTRVVAGFTTHVALKAATLIAHRSVENKLTDYKFQVLRNIDEQEQKIVRQAEEKIRHATCRSAVSMGVKSLIRCGTTYAGYRIIKRAIIELVQDEEKTEEQAARIAMLTAIVSGILWVQCLTPTMQRLHAAYQEGFNPNASTAREVASLVSKATEDLREWSHVDTVMDKFGILLDKLPEGSTTYLNNFTERVRDEIANSSESASHRSGES